MFLRFSTSFFLFIIALSSCSGGGSEQTTTANENGTWEFAMENNPTDFARQRFFGPGNKLTIVGDSVRMNNGFLNKLRTYPIQGKVSTDSIVSVGLVPTDLGGMEVSKYLNDSLVLAAVFYPETGGSKVQHEEIVGQTYFVTNEDQENFRLYLGNAAKLRTSHPVTNYFVVGDAKVEEKHSFLANSRGGWYTSPYDPRPLYEGYYLSSSMPMLSRNSTTIIRTPEGKLFINSLEVGKDRYEEKRLPMAPIPSVIPEDVDLTTFTDLVNYGKVIVDTRHSDPDTTKARFAYADDFTRFGLTVEELQDLEFNYSPLDGSYNTFVNRRKLSGGKWKLSPDRNNIIHLTQEDIPREVLPILAYDGESVEFRLPLKVQTRKPLGVELISYGSVDLYIRIEKTTSATK